MKTQETTVTKTTKKPKVSKTATAKAAKATKAPKQRAAKSEARAGSKKEIVLKLLRQDQGATLADIAKATDWQNHSNPGVSERAGDEEDEAEGGVYEEREGREDLPDRDLGKHPNLPPKAALDS